MTKLNSKYTWILCLTKLVGWLKIGSLEVWTRSQVFYFKPKSNMSSVQFSHSVVSDSLQPHRLQHTRLPCPSPTPGVCSNLCPLSQWCHPTISSSVILLFLHSIFPSIRVFSDESALHIRWPKYWSFRFCEQQLLEAALWNSEQVREAGVWIQETRNRNELTYKSEGDSQT